jgi:hypothetical protein
MLVVMFCLDDRAFVVRLSRYESCVLRCLSRAQSKADPALMDILGFLLTRPHLLLMRYSEYHGTVRPRLPHGEIESYRDAAFRW